MHRPRQTLVETTPSRHSFDTVEYVPLYLSMIPHFNNTQSTCCRREAVYNMHGAFGGGCFNSLPAAHTNRGCAASAFIIIAQCSNRWSVHCSRNQTWLVNISHHYITSANTHRLLCASFATAIGAYCDRQPHDVIGWSRSWIVAKRCVGDL